MDGAGLAGIGHAGAIADYRQHICKGYVDALSGVEIQSRYRTACRSDSHREEDDKLAEALTHWLFYIQEHQDLPYKPPIPVRRNVGNG